MSKKNTSSWNFTSHFNQHTFIALTALDPSERNKMFEKHSIDGFINLGEIYIYTKSSKEGRYRADILAKKYKHDENAISLFFEPKELFINRTGGNRGILALDTLNELESETYFRGKIISDVNDYENSTAVNEALLDEFKSYIENKELIRGTDKAGHLRSYIIEHRGIFYEYVGYAKNIVELSNIYEHNNICVSFDDLFSDKFIFIERKDFSDNKYRTNDTPDIKPTDSEEDKLRKTLDTARKEFNDILSEATLHEVFNETNEDGHLKCVGTLSEIKLQLADALAKTLIGIDEYNKFLDTLEFKRVVDE